MKGINFTQRFGDKIRALGVNFNIIPENLPKKSPEVGIVSSNCKVYFYKMKLNICNSEMNQVQWSKKSGV